MKNPLYHWRIRRKEAKIPVSRISGALKVTRQAVYMWERGQVRPRRSQWKGLAKLLDIRPPILIRRWAKWHESLGNIREAAELRLLADYFDEDQVQFSIVAPKRQRV